MRVVQPLPIDEHLPEIRSLWRRHPNFVLQSPPGSGKTTRVPPALLADPGLPAGAQIWVLLPRRLAAKMAALRVAEERGEKVGAAVGYHFRFEKALSKQTRLVFLTEGMLVRKLLGDPRLSGVHTVILDEFHERHLASDVALAYLRHLQNTSRPDLKLCLMSATFDAQALGRFLGGAPVFQAETPQYEVQVQYLAELSRQPMERLVAEHFRRHPLESGEDTLVFLPGMAEIRRTQEALRQGKAGPMELLALHGSMPPEDQQKIFQKFSRPKVVLATNIAESSLTIPGLRRVVDSGWHRQAEYSWWSGIPRLETRPIPQASAEQRAGRAGRTGPGTCYRLYTRWELESRPREGRPEIQRADLTQTFLELLALDIGDWEKFPWLETPPAAVQSHCLELLAQLGAAESREGHWRITPLGRQLSALPVHPRLGRLLLEGRERGVAAAALTLTAAISEGDLPEGPVEHVPAARNLRGNTAKLREQLARQLGEDSGAEPAREPEQALGLSLLAAFPDRVAQGKGRTWNFSQGGSGLIPQNLWNRIQDVYGAERFAVVLDVAESKRPGEKSQVQLRSWYPVTGDWLYEDHSGLLREDSGIQWMEAEGRLEARDCIRYGELILEESRGRPRDLDQACEVFLREALKYSESAPFTQVHDLFSAAERLGDPAPLVRALGKWKCLAATDLAPGLAPPESCLQGKFLRQLFHGFLRRSDWKDWPFEQRMLQTFPPEVQGRWQAWLPDAIALPGRKRVAIHYDWDHEPFVASRLQDFFGLQQGPTLFQGRLPLTLKLLAPNQRPVQVTKDLKNFWNKTYPELRPALSRRYPRHRWPGDPLAGQRES